MRRQEKLCVRTLSSPKETVSQPVSPLRGSIIFPLDPGLAPRAKCAAAAARLVQSLFDHFVLPPSYIRGCDTVSRRDLVQFPRYPAPRLQLAGLDWFPSGVSAKLGWSAASKAVTKLRRQFWSGTNGTACDKLAAKRRLCSEPGAQAPGQVRNCAEPRSGERSFVTASSAPRQRRFFMSGLKA